MTRKITEITITMHEIRDMIVSVDHHRNQQVMTWGVGIIGGLLATIGVLAHRFLL
jgi:hypothetical protein